MTPDELISPTAQPVNPALFMAYAPTDATYDPLEPPEIVVTEPELRRETIAPGSVHPRSRAASATLEHLRADIAAIIERGGIIEVPFDLPDLSVPRERRTVAKSYNADQPREPKGSPTGGRWIATGAGRLTGPGKTASDPHTSVEWQLSAEDPPPLNGIPFEPWTPPKDWRRVKGTKDIAEPDGPTPKTWVDRWTDKKTGEKHEDVHTQRVGAGVIIQEPDGRVWLVEPKNHFGGYEQTFPKGGQEEGLTLQQTAIKEAWEESGLKVNITGHAFDQERTTSVARYYWAERAGGTPTDFGEETHAVHLVPVAHLHRYLNTRLDRELAKATLNAPMPHRPSPFSGEGPGKPGGWGPSKAPGSPSSGSGAGGTGYKSPWLPKGVHQPGKAKWWETDEGDDEPPSFWSSIKRIVKKGMKDLVAKYNPDQPRDPKGTPTGGQWAAVGHFGPPDASGFPSKPAGLDPVAHKAQINKVNKLEALAKAGKLDALKATFVGTAAEKHYKNALIAKLEEHQTLEWAKAQGLPLPPPNDYHAMYLLKQAKLGADPKDALKIVMNAWAPSHGSTYSNGFQYKEELKAVLQYKITSNELEAKGLPKLFEPKPEDNMGYEHSPFVKDELLPLAHQLLNASSPQEAQQLVQAALKDTIPNSIMGNWLAATSIALANKIASANPDANFTLAPAKQPNSAYIAKTPPPPPTVMTNGKPLTPGIQAKLAELQAAVKGVVDPDLALAALGKVTVSMPTTVAYKQQLESHFVLAKQAMQGSVAGKVTNPHGVPEPPQLEGFPNTQAALNVMYLAAQNPSVKDAMSAVHEAAKGLSGVAQTKILTYKNQLLDHLGTKLTPAASYGSSYTTLELPTHYTTKTGQPGLAMLTVLDNTEAGSLGGTLKALKAAAEGKSSAMDAFNAVAATSSNEWDTADAYKAKLLLHLAKQAGISNTALAGMELSGLFHLKHVAGALALENLSPPSPIKTLIDPSEHPAYAKGPEPKAPVVTGTSAGALWAANKVLELQQASVSSDPVGNILKVSLTKTTPKYIKDYHAKLLAYHQQQGQTTTAKPGAAKPASPAGQVTNAVQAAKGQKTLPPLPAPPPVNAAKYTPEQIAVYQGKIKALQDAAVGPNPLIAIDKVPAQATSVQAYKSQLIQWITDNAPAPDAYVGETLSSYKIVAEHALPQPPLPAQRTASEMSAKHAHVRSSLPDKQREALSYYQGSGYHALNAHRFNPGAPLPSNHKALDKALQAGALDKDTFLSRKIQSTALAGIAKALVGRIIEDPAYGSTSISPSTWAGNVQWMIRAPAGTRGMWMAGSSYSAEQEWLLPRQTRYRVFKVAKEEGYTRIYAEILPASEQNWPTGD